jgi:murein DD-endopeptidase MepM/ murein hydrolase activator NlpD
MILGIAVVFGFVATGLVVRKCVLAGPLKPDSGPEPGDSKYFLPWEPRRSHFCFQGNAGLLSHKGRCKFAWDFLMPIGTRITASRAGRVVEVIDKNDGHGRKKPNNEIYVEHEDGTQARYCHVKRLGSAVKVGQLVTQGEFIALSGNVGKSLGPHLHFEVTDAEKNTIPIKFDDVSRHLGVPRAFYFYCRVSACRPQICNGHFIFKRDLLHPLRYF